MLSEAYDDISALALANLDGDGDLDVVVGTTDGELALIYNPRVGTETMWMASTQADDLGVVSGVAVGSLDGDEDIDVIAASHSLGVIRWWENTPGGFVQHDVTADFAGVTSIDVGNVDGDGHLDVVAASDQLNAVRLRDNDSGTGIGLLERTVATDFEGAKKVVIADLNGSGNREIVVGGVADQGSFGRLAHYTLQGSSWIGAELDLQSITGLSAGDLDSDGYDDPLACNGSIGMLFHNDRAGGFNRVLVDRTMDGCNGALIADLDGPALPELLFSEVGTDHGIDLIGIWNDGSVRRPSLPGQSTSGL